MRQTLLWLAALAGAAAPALGWNAHGHRTVTYLALDAMAAHMDEATPAWLLDAAARGRIAHQSGEPDRWRALRMAALAHENSPDHYIDLEQLEDFGLTLQTVPPLRNEYLKAMILAKHQHPERVRPYDEGRDRERTKEWPGFLPHAIAEHYAKLAACYKTVRILEALGEPESSPRLQQARANAEYHMGVLAHFVGDAAQPLHTTVHHHGWTGDNPNGYTTDYGIHSYVDGRLLEIHALGYDSLRGAPVACATVNADDPWEGVSAYIARSFSRVEPLYRLHRDGELEADRGKAFMAERLTDAAGMLAGLYAAAWSASEPTDADMANFLRFDAGLPGATAAGAAASPARSAPATPAASK